MERGSDLGKAAGTLGSVFKNRYIQRQEVFGRMIIFLRVEMMYFGDVSQSLVEYLVNIVKVASQIIDNWIQ